MFAPLKCKCWWILLLLPWVNSLPLVTANASLHVLRLCVGGTSRAGRIPVPVIPPSHCYLLYCGPFFVPSVDHAEESLLLIILWIWMFGGTVARDTSYLVSFTEVFFCSEQQHLMSRTDISVWYFCCLSWFSFCCLRNSDLCHRPFKPTWYDNNFVIEKKLHIIRDEYSSI
jgi:hypothetical protein